MTMGLPVDRKEIDRVLAVPVEMLCSARYATLEDSYRPAAAAARPAPGGSDAADGDEDDLWADFTYTGPVKTLLPSSDSPQFPSTCSSLPLVFGCSNVAC